MELDQSRYCDAFNDGPAFFFFEEGWEVRKVTQLEDYISGYSIIFASISVLLFVQIINRPISWIIITLRCSQVQNLPTDKPMTKLIGTVLKIGLGGSH